MLCETCIYVLSTVRKKAREQSGPISVLQGDCLYHYCSDSFKTAVSIGCLKCRRFWGSGICDYPDVPFGAMCHWILEHCEDEEKLSLTIKESFNSRRHYPFLILRSVEPFKGIPVYYCSGGIHHGYLFCTIY